MAALVLGVVLAFAACGKPAVTPAPTPSPIVVNGMLVVEAFDDPAVFGGPGQEVLRYPVSAGDGFAILGEVSGDGPTREDAWISPDGRHWERVRGIPSMADAFLTGLAELPGGPLVAVGRRGPEATAWHSADAGRTWTAVRLPDAPAGTNLGEIVAGPSGAVVVGYRSGPDATTISRLWWSPDGADWTAVAMRDEVFGTVEIRGIAPSGTGFVATGGRYLTIPAPRLDPLRGMRAAAWTSPDGRTWAAAAIEDAPPLGPVFAGSEGMIAFGVAEDLGPAVTWFSIDGSSWHRLADPLKTGNSWVAVRDGRIFVLRSRFEGRQTTLELSASPNGVDWTVAGTGPVERGGGTGVVAAGTPGLIQVGLRDGDVQVWLIPWPLG